MAKTSPSDTAVDKTASAAHDSAPTGKGHATPTRKEKEEARKRPLVSSDRAAARRQQRTQVQQQRERARIGMAAGEEKYLPVRDRGPQKRYVRDYVDARFSVGELMIPLLLIVIVLSMLPQPEVAVYSTIVLWAFALVVIVDVVVLGFTINRKLREKFGADRVEKVRFYAAMRAIQLRLMRLPKPQVKRGQFPA